MQRTIGMYIANRIRNEIFAKPEPDEDPDGHDEYVDPLDGETIVDDDGRALGTARRLRDVAVYVVTGSRANPDAELERAINEPESELIIHREGRRITALVYIPEQAEGAPPSTMRGFRADDV